MIFPHTPTRVAGTGPFAFLIYLPSANLQSDIWIVGNPLVAFYVNGPVVLQNHFLLPTPFRLYKQKMLDFLIGN